ncbi:MAG: CBS domain-containing protein [Halobacteriota archaeon]|nr:CBS domain-containing protein [Halobacteriota archaeon]
MKMKIEEIMTKDVISVKEDDTLLKVASVFKENNVAGVPVIDDGGNVVGVISEADILKVLEDFQWYTPLFKTLDFLGLHEEKLHDIEEDIKKASDMKVRDVMSKIPKTIRPDDLIDDAAMIMRSTGFNRLPVVDRDKKLVGMVARADIIASLYDI